MIHIFWPTVRTKMAADRAALWIERSSSEWASTGFKFVFCVEPDADKTPLRNLKARFHDVTIFSCKSPHAGAAYPATVMTQHFDVADEDIAILGSDDWEPSKDRKWWDEIIRTYFEQNKEGCFIDDGYKVGTNIVGLPIISGRLLRRLNGILYNPHYKHFYSDQELHDILREIGELGERRDSAIPLFTHKHHSFGGRVCDAFDSRTQQNWDFDLMTYDKRKDLSVAEKLKLPEWFHE